MTAQNIMHTLPLNIKSVLCVSIPGPSLNDARRQIRRANGIADLLEFRLDLFDFSKVDAIHHLMEAATLPVIFTLRKREWGGGGYSGDEEERVDAILSLAQLAPAYFDLEHDNDLSLFQKVQQVSPSTKLICSYHNFFETPKALNELLASMKEIPAALYKICCMANSSLDNLSIFRLLQQAKRQDVPLVALCMGEKGTPSRILGPCFGSAITYSSLEVVNTTAPGQISAEALNSRYRHKTLSSSTALFSLLGNPISLSPSHRTHNNVMEILQIDASFTKFAVLESELSDFFEQVKKLGFSGFCVTMPHKQAAFSLINNQEDPTLSVIKAVNTVKIENKQFIGCNTDGKGALEAIERKIKVKGKTCVILGAGGAAKAVAYEAKQRGALVVLLNRTVTKAESVAKDIGAERFGSLELFPKVAKEGYDVLINCTSIGMYEAKNKFPIDMQYLLPGKIVIDSIPTVDETPFLQKAVQAGCQVIVGYEMLMYQAVEQFLFWYGNCFTREQILEAFTQAFRREFKGKKL